MDGGGWCDVCVVFATTDQLPTNGVTSHVEPGVISTELPATGAECLTYSRATVKKKMSAAKKRRVWWEGHGNEHGESDVM